GERLYGEACEWVRQQFPMESTRSWPCITVRVGVACPDGAVSGPCANPVNGDIFIPRWGKTSPATIAQGTISTMLLRLMKPKEIAKVAQNLLTRDVLDFFDFVPPRKTK